MSEPCCPKMPEKKNGFDKWEVDSAVDTLLRAEEIKQNAGLMKEVKKKMNDKAKAINSIADLKAKRDELAMDEDDD